MAGQKISEFNVSTSLTNSDLFTFVVNGTNKSIAFSDLKAELGVTGTLATDGASLGTPILEIIGTDYKIRNLEDSKGIITSVSAENGITVGCNFAQSAIGYKVIHDLDADVYQFKTLIAGSNITITESDEELTFDVETVTPPTVAGAVCGFIDYQDATTATTPISVPGTSTFTQLTNDGAGGSTNKDYPPDGVTELWNASTNRFDFSELTLGDQLEVRIDIEITTTAANQECFIELELGTGGTPYILPVYGFGEKSAGTRALAPCFNFYMGNANTLNNTGRIGVKSDTACTVKVNGWYIKVAKYNA